MTVLGLLMCGAAALALPSRPDAASTAEVRAVLYVEPSSAEIGEPVELVVAVEHLADTTLALPDAAPLPDESAKSAPTWMALGERRVSRFELGEGRARTLHRWNVASLTAGERALGPVHVAIGGDAERVVATETASLSVGAALAEGEDAPRAAVGFLPAPEESAPPAAWFGGTLAAVLVAYVAWRVVRRRRRATLAVAAPTPLDVLAALEARAAATPESAREITADVVALLRRAVDELQGAPRAALTDSAWVARVERDESLPLGVRTATARMLTGAERVKYALETPTRFALAETIADARAVLEALRTAAPAEKKEAA